MVELQLLSKLYAHMLDFLLAHMKVHFLSAFKKNGRFWVLRPKVLLIEYVEIVIKTVSSQRHGKLYTSLNEFLFFYDLFSFCILTIVY